MAVQAMIEATNEGRPALYTSAVRFFAMLKATYRKDSKETELDLIALHRKPSLLVIDEIGKRGETAWEGNLLFELLNNRYADMTDTIVIANLGPQELAENLGSSITSRLNETGGVIHCDWLGRR
jgi:DNA replication protein DnaC